MKVTLTREEMLRRRRTAAGLDTLRSDCSIEQTDGLTVDEILEPELRRRYLRFLDTAPVELLAPDDLCDDAVCYPSAAGGAAIRVPLKCRRVLEVRLNGWERSCRVQPPDKAASVMALQLNPYTAATGANPAAVLDPSRTTVLVWPATTGLIPTVSLFTAITDPGEDFYVLDEAGIYEF